MNSQKGAVPILILIALIGVLGFIGVANSADFKNQLFGGLYPKPASEARTPPISSPISSRPSPTPIPKPTVR